MALNRGALSAVVQSRLAQSERRRDAAKRRQERAEQLEDDKRKFTEKLTEASVRSGQASFDPKSGKVTPREPVDFRALFGGQGGAQAPQGLTGPLQGGGVAAQSSLLQDQDLERKFTFKDSFGNTATVSSPKLTPPSEAESLRLQRGAAPGQPFRTAPGVATKEVTGAQGQPLTRMLGPAGGLPSSSGGNALLQQLISQGLTESPAAQQLGGGQPQQAGLLERLRGLTGPAASAARGGGVGAFSQGLGGIQRTLGGRGEAAPDLDPSDSSLAGPSGSTEGARVEMPDGSVWEVQDGEWVQVN